MPPLALNCPTMATAVGRGMGIHREALRTRRSGLRPNDLPRADLETMIGRVEGLEDEPLTGGFADFDCRNNRLATCWKGRWL
jgi:3-oxoacyl-[acyl-carrier-protein] synthase-1